jgi:membrane associated rhomboid family serine protease
VLPLRDENPTRRVPVVTILLIAANIAVYFLVQPGDPDSVESARFSLERAAIPCEVVEGRPLSVSEIQATYGRGDDTACQGDAAEAGPPLFPGKHVLLAVLTSMFLHGSLLHLGGNMLFLWIFGNNVEDRLGPAGYLVLYLAAGIVATGAHIAVQPDSTVPVVGASGAIAGVMGAYLVWYPNAPILTLFLFFIILFRRIPAKWLLLGWIGLQFLEPFNPNSGVAWVAHVGGFVFGALVALVLRATGGSAVGSPLPSGGPSYGDPYR